MSERTWQSVAASGGVAFVLLQGVAQSLIQVGGLEPAFNAPAAEIVAFFDRRNATLFALGNTLSILSSLAFLWFLGPLWLALRQAEGEPGWLAPVALGSGLVAMATLLGGGGGWELALWRLGDSLSPEMVQLHFDQGNYAFAAFWVPLASLLLAVGLAALRHGALPRWVGWYSLGLAPLLLAARVYWTAPSGLVFAPYVLFWLWLLAVSFILIRRARRPGA